MVAISGLDVFKKKVDEMERLKKKFPNWILREREGFVYGFLDARGVRDESKPETKDNSFPLAVRVSLHGIFLFSTKKEPNRHYLTESDYLSLTKIKELQNKGVHPIEVGNGRVDGSISFSDCMYEPGVFDEDYLQIKSLFQDISAPYLEGIKKAQGGSK